MPSRSAGKQNDADALSVEDMRPDQAKLMEIEGSIRNAAARGSTGPLSTAACKIEAVRDRMFAQTRRRHGDVMQRTRGESDHEGGAQVLCQRA